MLSIIIVNYKSEALVLDCLRSIRAQPAASEFEIILVDNGSAPAQKERILEEFPALQWLEMGYNAGFARANNKGILHSKGHVVLLLNPDVIVEENAIEVSYNRLVNSDFIGCGVQLLNSDRSPQISGNYFMRGGLNHLLPLPVLGKVFKWMGQQLNIRKTNLPEAKRAVEVVDWINGAYLMVKKDAIEKTGMLDEDFFLYAEEIEWCSRLHRLGRLCIYGDLHVVHLQGEVGNESFDAAAKGYFNLFDRRGKQLMVSNFLRIRKQYGVSWLLLHLFFYLVEIPFFFLLAVFFENYTMKQFAGYCQNLFSLIKLLPRIISGRPHFYKVI